MQLCKKYRISNMLSVAEPHGEVKLNTQEELNCLGYQAKSLKVCPEGCEPGCNMIKVVSQKYNSDR